jgi:hypothetical protein
VPTLVLPPRHTADSAALWKAAIDNGWKTERLSNWRVPDWLVGQEVVLYGEPLFAAVVAKPLGIALLEPPHSWLPQLNKAFRKREVRLCTLGDARNINQEMFIKPADDKCFLAKVYRSGNEIPGLETLDENTAVLVSEVVEWDVEFRGFVADGELLTLSPYLRSGELAQASDGTWPATTKETFEANDFANTVLNDDRVRCPPAFVLDVGKIKGVGWAVVEANAAWGSGIYGCLPKRVLTAVQRACVPSGCLTAEDRCWVIERGVAT